MNGAFIIDKPAGITSHDVVARVRKIIGERRVGHTGTLDPFATGVLVILFGRATRLAQFLSGAEKEYEAVIRLGLATDTGDITGAPLASGPAENLQGLRPEDIEAAMSSFRGGIDQIPPMHSAKKIEGRKLYELARKGEEVTRIPVRITVSEFEAIPGDAALFKINSDGTADLHVRVVCSAGTYIRTLAEDLGKHLGVGAHLAELRRTRAGAFRIAEAITLERLAELSGSNLAESKVISPDAVLSHLPAIDLSAAEVTRTIHGIDIRLEQAVLNFKDGAPVRMRSPDNQLIAVGLYDESQSAVHPTAVIADVSEARP